MTGETSGPSAQDIRMASFEEKFNDLLNFVRLLVKRDTESEKQVEDINKDTSEDNTGGHSHTNLGPPPVQPSKSEERDFQLDAKVEKTMRSTKMVDASALLALAKPDVENEVRTVDPNVAPENDPSPKGNRNTLEGPQSLHMYGNGEENVMNKKEDDHSDIRSLQGQPLYPSNQGDTIEPHSDVDGHSSKGSKESEKEAQSPISKKEEPKEVDHPMIPHKRPHLLHDSSKKCEFHFGRPGHSLEDCHALKNKVQDLVDHGILRINEGSTPSVIIAWPPEHCKDETVIPSPQSQRPTTCGIQPVHLTMLPTLSEDKVEYRTSRCMTLKRKIQGLGHSEPDVPFMVQARKPSMHTVPMKKARSTLGFGANGPSRDQTERTIPRSTGAWIPHRQG
uniref:Retrotransposon gag domain-containing protein n=1 Tax=Fagus sylvatica TaxID=28930 RepID=A0A2N9FJ45_FAGSY